MDDVNVIRSPPDGTSNNTDSALHQQPVAYIAPALRVEELREEVADDTFSGSSLSGTDDEFGVNAGDVSDQDMVRERVVAPVDTEFIPPDEELQKLIASQVEQYFADENILHDTFMLKHVRRNRLGFVSLKLVTSFRKVKPLTKDHRAVAFSVRQFSERLEVNEEGTKVRRRDPLPEVDETTSSRTLVVGGLPMDTPTMENVSDILSSFGEIVSIRIWRAGKPVPSDVKKHLVRLGAEYTERACAVVEFDEHESAMRAQDHLAKLGDGEESKNMKAVFFASTKGDRPKKVEKEEAPRKTAEHDSSSENWREAAGRNQDGKGKSSKPKNAMKAEWRKSAPRVSELVNEADIDSAGSESDPGTDNWRTGKQRNSAVISRSSLSPQVDSSRLSPGQSPRTTPKTTPKSSPKSSPRTSPNPRRRTLGTSPLAVEIDERRNSERRNSEGTSPSQSPWVQRRLKAQETSVSPLAGNSVNSSPRLPRKAVAEDNVSGAISRFADGFGVIRQPRGPDGTRGFHENSEKGNVVSEVDSNMTGQSAVSVA